MAIDKPITKIVDEKLNEIFSDRNNKDDFEPILENESEEYEEEPRKVETEEKEEEEEGEGEDCLPCRFNVGTGFILNICKELRKLGLNCDDEKLKEDFMARKITPLNVIDNVLAIKNIPEKAINDIMEIKGLMKLDRPDVIEFQNKWITEALPIKKPIKEDKKIISNEEKETKLEIKPKQEPEQEPISEQSSMF